MPVPYGHLSGFDMASKVRSVIMFSGLSPSAGATHMVCLKLSGFSTHIMLACGAPLICLLCSSPCSIVVSSSSLSETHSGCSASASLLAIVSGCTGMATVGCGCSGILYNGTALSAQQTLHYQHNGFWELLNT